MLPDSPPSNRRVTRETARRQRFQRGRKPPTRRGARACDSRRKPIGRRESGHRMAAPPFARSSRNTFPLSLSTLFLKRSGNRRAYVIDCICLDTAELLKPPFSMAYHAKASVNENLPERSLKGMLREERGGGSAQLNSLISLNRTTYIIDRSFFYLNERECFSSFILIPADVESGYAFRTTTLYAPWSSSPRPEIFRKDISSHQERERCRNA